MKNLLIRGGFAVLGMVLVLGWWTIKGRNDSGNSATSDKIPSKVWEGGAGTVTIEAESSAPATLRAYFSSAEKSESGTPNRSLEAWEKFPAGQHTWTIDVPAGTSGSLEFEAVGPKPGSTLSWTVRAGDKQIAQETEKLEQPLRANEAFFLQVEVDDFATGKLEGEE